MIVKVIQRNGKKSSFKALANYIKRTGKKDEKETSTFLKNCNADDFELALLEIKTTQALNKRAKGNKTYHLLVSFDAQDKITTDQAHKIIDELTKEIGFENHQMIIAEHKDTDNLHYHVAINKIHPETLKMFVPYRDKLALMDKAVELEKQLSLTKTNHSRKKESVKTKDFEYQGVKSFEKWVVSETRKEINEIIKNGGDWQKINAYLAQKNLEMRKRGAGFVISDKKRKLFVKASLVSRNFKKLGAFKPNNESPDFKDPPLKSFSFNPAPETSLWNEYKNDKEDRFNKKRSFLKTAKKEKLNIKKHAQRRRKKVKDSKYLTYIQKKRLYSLIQIQEKKSLSKYYKIPSSVSAISWIKFLQNEYASGNKEALKTLKRTSLYKKHELQNSVESKTKIKINHNKKCIDKSGSIFITINDNKVILSDKKISTANSDNLIVIEKMLKIGKEAGGSLNLKGSPAFLKNAELVAKVNNIDIVGNNFTKTKPKRQKQNTR